MPPKRVRDLNQWAKRMFVDQLSVLRKDDRPGGWLSRPRFAGGPMCGCIWTPPDCNGFDRFWFSVTTADVYPAS